MYVVCKCNNIHVKISFYGEMRNNADTHTHTHTPALAFFYKVTSGSQPPWGENPLVGGGGDTLTRSSGFFHKTFTKESRLKSI